MTLYTVLIRDRRDGSEYRFNVPARPTSYTPAAAKAAQAARKLARLQLRCKADDLTCISSKEL